MTEQNTELLFLKSSRKRRIVAFIIDHFVMTFLMVATVFIALGPKFVDENNPNKLMITLLFVIPPAFILYFAKDSYRGISLGKWIMGIMVRDENNQNTIPSFGRLFLRNLPIVIWPIEFIILATNDQKKRLGDKIAKTVVLKNPRKPTKLPRILTLFGLGMVFFGFIFFTSSKVIKNSEAYNVSVKEIEQNKEIINETGGIIGYGMLPSGNVSVVNGYGEAQFEIKVLGNKKDLNVTVYLVKEREGQWKLVEIHK